MTGRVFRLLPKHMVSVLAVQVCIACRVTRPGYSYLGRCPVWQPRNIEWTTLMGMGVAMSLSHQLSLLMLR